MSLPISFVEEGVGVRCWAEVVNFPEEKVETMRKFIQEKRATLQERGLFINTILREDVFDILDACCTVVFYPFEEDENDGFQVERPVNYGGGYHMQQFVYLNTAKGLEKQVFAVGHELGHIWKVADKIWDGALEQELPREEYEEAAMNRFAAELLMPQEEFQKSANGQLSVCRKKGKTTYFDCARIIANLMNEFCVPMAATVVRLYETKCLPGETCERLLFTGPGHLKPEEYQESFKRILNNCIKEAGYTRLQKPTFKKGIRDFPQLLRDAEKAGVFSPQKAEKLRAELEIPDVNMNETGLDETGLE